jgi:hypothetical protein
MQAVPQKSLVRDAYERGRTAAYHGFLRVSPYYNNRVLIAKKRVDITPMLDTFWYAGFDGEAYPDKPEEPHGQVARKSDEQDGEVRHEGLV